LLHDPQPLGQRVRQFRHHLRHDLRKILRALAAAEYQQVENMSCIRRLIGRDCVQHLLAYRIADQPDAGHLGGRKPVNRLKRGGDNLCPANTGRQPVGPAGNGVLLVYHAGNAGAARSHHHRQRRVSAKPDDHPRPEPVKQPLALAIAFCQPVHLHRQLPGTRRRQGGR
jgi:hypothetical protein